MILSEILFVPKFHKTEVIFIYVFLIFGDIFILYVVYILDVVFIIYVIFICDVFFML